MKYKSRHEKIQDNDLVIASIRRRTFAILIDILILGMLFLLIIQTFRILGFDLKQITIEGLSHVDIKGENISHTGISIIKLFLAFLPTIYFTLTTYFLNGQTIGKKLLKIRVIALCHDKVGLWHCLERSLGYVASSLELGLGFIQAFWNPNKMALHDKIAETVVMSIESPKKVIRVDNEPLTAHLQ